MKLHIRALIATEIDINNKIVYINCAKFFDHDYYHKCVLAQLDPEKFRSDTKHAQNDSSGKDRGVLWSFLIFPAVFISKILLVGCHSSKIAVKH